ncbi:MAG: hypothetical protein Q4E51_02955 [Lachnospiraceae bacterium]|nr:hypothetical protein [Lachnospiraceae bacterium]
MINFDEELRKFPQSMEINEVEESVRNHDLTDVTDLLTQMLEQNKALQNQQVVVQTIPVQPGQ